MLVFLDFEASSLAKRSYPIEVGWVFEDGRGESYLIVPPSGWDDWDPGAEAIHGIGREMLLHDGVPHEVVARRMIEMLTGHDLLASAPSWDGKWLSILLRAAGYPRHSLRVRDSDDAHREAAEAILRPQVPADRLATLVERVLVDTEPAVDETPAHRALADAEAERGRWLAVLSAAQALAASLDA